MNEPKFKVGDTVRGKGGPEGRKVLRCRTVTIYTVTRTGGLTGATELEEDDLEPMPVCNHEWVYPNFEKPRCLYCHQIKL
jgi:hypothetical protein